MGCFGEAGWVFGGSSGSVVFDGSESGFAHRW